MTDQNPSEELRPESDKSKTADSRSPSAPAKLPGERDGAPTEGETSTPKKLTAEEQMALYEKDLKENDWGHQPC